MRRYPERIAVNDAVAGSHYIRGMMSNRLSTTFLTAFAVSAVAALGGAPVALAQAYPPPPGYSQPLQPAPYGAPGGYQDDRGAPELAPKVPEVDACAPLRVEALSVHRVRP